MKLVVIGGGILGLSVAREALIRGVDQVVVIEKESSIATHQSSRNSGVIHAGIYYKPGSFKASLCRKGMIKMKEYCRTKNIPVNECGKLIVAVSEDEEQRLSDLYEQGRHNGLKNLRKLDKTEASSIEPNVAILKAIQVPEESIVDYKVVAKSYLNDILQLGGKILFKTTVSRIVNSNISAQVLISSDQLIDADYVISCAGLFGDKLASSANLDTNQSKIIPFKVNILRLRLSTEILLKALFIQSRTQIFLFLGYILRK